MRNGSSRASLRGCPDWSAAGLLAVGALLSAAPATGQNCGWSPASITSSVMMRLESGIQTRLSRRRRGPHDRRNQWGRLGGCRVALRQDDVAGASIPKSLPTCPAGRRASTISLRGLAASTARQSMPVVPARLESRFPVARLPCCRAGRALRARVRQRVSGNVRAASAATLRWRRAYQESGALANRRAGGLGGVGGLSGWIRAQPRRPDHDPVAASWFRDRLQKAVLIGLYWPPVAVRCEHDRVGHIGRMVSHAHTCRRGRRSSRGWTDQRAHARGRRGSRRLGRARQHLARQRTSSISWFWMSVFPTSTGSKSCGDLRLRHALDDSVLADGARRGRGSCRARTRPWRRRLPDQAVSR